MDRQSSLGSESSAGSAFSGRSSESRGGPGGAGGGKDGHGGVEDVQQQQQLKKALFGALYTLAKEKINDSARMAYLAIGVDFILILGLFMMPEFPWSIDEHSPFYKVFFYIEFHLPIAHAGYKVYLGVFYALVATLFLSTGICVWVGWCFKNDSFPFLWPIKVARVVVSLFVSMFYIASLNVFLIAMQCQPATGADGKRHWTHLIYHLDCLSLPHVIHAAFSLASSVLFFVVAFLLVVADHELEPMSRSLLAAPHSMCELRMLLCKTAITVADILLRPLPHYQASVYAAACALMLWYQIRWAPHLSAWINCFRAGLNAVLCWVSVCLFAVTFSVEWHDNDEAGSHAHYTWSPRPPRVLWTTLMAGGLPVAFLGGMAAMYARLYHAWRVALKFAAAPPDARPRRVHRFLDDLDVEVAARVGRVLDPDGVPCDAGALDAAEAVLRAGVTVFPDSPYLHIVYSNFLIEVRKNDATGWSQLEAARKLKPNLSYQFSIFTREQEHKQRAAGGAGGGGGGGSGGGGVDLVSYVEFQKNYRALVGYHRAALEAGRDFWRLAMRSAVPVAAAADTFARIDAMEGAAHRTYRLVLERYPSNAKLLRSYARFLEGVRNDPWGAAKYYAEADRQEELALATAPEAALGGLAEGNAALAAAAASRDAAVVTIDAAGSIQSVNRAAERLFGYGKGELDGKNVAALMPPPHGARHSGYLRAFAAGSEAHILDRACEVVAIRRDRTLFPVSLTVGRASGSGADATFIGVMRAAPAAAADEVKAWLALDGTVLCIDQAFTDYTAWTPPDVEGRPLAAIAADPAEAERLLQRVAMALPEQLSRGVDAGPLRLRHKYLGAVRVAVRLSDGGAPAHRVLVAAMRRATEPAAVAAVDQKGRLVFANAPLAAMLGYRLQDLAARDFGSLLPPPQNALHAQWLKDSSVAEMGGRPPPGSCRGGATVELLRVNGVHLPVRVAVAHHAGALGQPSVWSVAVTRSSGAAAADERRLLLRVTFGGDIVGVSEGTPPALFGLEPRRLVGARLDDVVDVCREWGKAGRPMAVALSALAARSEAVLGSTWRVGVGRLKEAEAEAAADAVQREAGAGGLRAAVRRSGLGGEKVRGAVMTVAAASDDDDGHGREQQQQQQEHHQQQQQQRGSGGRGDDNDSADLVIELWRADLMCGTVELGPTCRVTRADAAAGRMFGVPQASMLSQHVQRYVRVPDGAALEDLLELRSAKRGGIKRAAVHKVGPAREVRGRHPDGREFALSLQVALKDGAVAGPARGVAVIKPLRPAKGDPGMLEALVAGGADGNAGAAGPTRRTTVAGEAVDSSSEEEEEEVAAAEGEGGGGGGGQQTAAGAGGGEQQISTAAASKVPGLQLGKAKLQTGTGGPEARGSGNGGGMTTRRTAGAAAVTARGVELFVSSQPPSDRKPARRSGAGAAAATEEEQEAQLAAQGGRKARAWLESGFAGVAGGSEADLPGAVVGGGGGSSALDGGTEAGASERSGRVGGAGGRAPSEGGASGVGGAEGGNAGSAAGDDASSVSGAASRSGDYARGKRLRRLLRALNSGAVTALLHTFRTRMVAMALAVLLLHAAAYGVVAVLLGAQAGHLRDIDAAGNIGDALHRALGYARVIEAAQRGGRGAYEAARDMPAYAALLEAQLNRWEALHQGTYLGFGRLTAIGSPAIRELWHEPRLSVQRFDNATGGGAVPSGNETLSLFNLGALLVAAGREVAFLGRRGAAATPVADAASFQYLLTNAPGTAHAAYLRSLNLMTLRAQSASDALRRVVLALLVAEGVAVSAGAVAAVVYILRGLMRHRAALFSVFLAVPHAALRTLASKSTRVADEDEDAASDDEDARAAADAADAAKAAAKERDGARKAGSRGGGSDDDEEDAGGGGGAKGGGGASLRRRVSIAGGARDDDGGGAAGGGGGGGQSARGGQLNLASLMAVSIEARRALLCNGKRLRHGARDLVALAWPFVAWGALVTVLYGISYARLVAVGHDLVAEKLGLRTVGQISRVAFYAGEAALTEPAAARAAAQLRLADEAALLRDVYTAQLYGGPTLPDSVADGARDAFHGALFLAKAHADALFRNVGCLRWDQAACAPADSAWHAVTHAGVDALLWRAFDEAEALVAEDPAAIAPGDAGAPYAFLWGVAAQDLHDGAADLAGVYAADVRRALAAQQALHAALLAAVAAAVLAYLALLLRPFLARVRREGKRAAELLVQLPAEVDCDALVIALTGLHEGDGVAAAAAAARSSRAASGAAAASGWFGPGGPPGGGGGGAGQQPGGGMGQQYGSPVFAMAGGGGVGGGVGGGEGPLFTPRVPVDSVSGSPSPHWRGTPRGAAMATGFEASAADGGVRRRFAPGARRVAPEDVE